MRAFNRSPHSIRVRVPLPVSSRISTETHAAHRRRTTQRAAEQQQAEAEDSAGLQTNRVQLSRKYEAGSALVPTIEGERYATHSRREGIELNLDETKTNSASTRNTHNATRLPPRSRHIRVRLDSSESATCCG